MLTLEERAVRDRITRRGRKLVVNGIAFVALLNVAPPLDPSTELGSDPREKCIAELLAPGPAIAANDYIADAINADNKWQVVFRDSNTADLITIKYWLAKVVKDIDT